jgi:hypothetical protein
VEALRGCSTCKIYAGFGLVFHDIGSIDTQFVKGGSDGEDGRIPDLERSSRRSSMTNEDVTALTYLYFRAVGPTANRITPKIKPNKIQIRIIFFIGFSNPDLPLLCYRIKHF